MGNLENVGTGKQKNWRWEIVEERGATTTTKTTKKQQKVGNLQEMCVDEDLLGGQ